MMWNLDQAYIDGAFVPVHGDEILDLINPATEQQLGTVRLASREDAKQAIAAAQRGQAILQASSKQDRIEMLQALQAAILHHADAIRDSTIEEYGAPCSRAQWVSQYASDCFARSAEVLRHYDLQRQLGAASVWMEPVGVSALIIPWNSTAGTICSKLSSALAAGCATVIKPSEFSPMQTHVVAQALHQAGLPAGIFNIVIGRGPQVGDELSTNLAVSKISFTGSTETGKRIAKAGLDSMKRLSLALSGKSASIVLDDADLASAIPHLVQAAMMNNGQACVAGSRLLVPRSRLPEVIEQVAAQVSQLRIGDPRDPQTDMGPLLNRSQYERVQALIERGSAQGARLLIGGQGRPRGLASGYFVRPTVFAEVDHRMDIARQEIFGPVLSIISYENEDEAIAIANDSIYGLQAYVFSTDIERTRRVAGRLQAGSVLINRSAMELQAPFGGFKQSGLGREHGVFGLEAFLEPKAVVMD